MRCFWDDRQRLHAPAGEFFNGSMHAAAESLLRVDAILSAIGRTETPTDVGIEPILEVHDRGYIKFLQQLISNGSMPDARVMRSLTRFRLSVVEHVNGSGSMPRSAIIALIRQHQLVPALGKLATGAFKQLLQQPTQSSAGNARASVYVGPPDITLDTTTAVATPI